jgi:hypothetical protein
MTKIGLSTRPLKKAELWFLVSFPFRLSYFWERKMKKLLFFAMILVSVSAFAQTDPIELKEMEYDFGKIPQNKPVYHSFQVINKGNQPLKLDNVQASCGCTTPEWSKEDIAAGKTSIIKVGYNAASEGHFEKFITVTYNGNQTKMIKIKGEVWKAPSGAAPANSSVQFLKQQIQ